MGHDATPASALRATALVWTAPGNRFTLEAEGWRSFQPIRGGPDGEPLIVVLRLRGDRPIEATVNVTDVQMVRGDSVWTSQPSEVRPADGGEMEIVVRNGPAWAPGDAVDLVARVHDGRASALLRAPRFVIQRVD